MYWLVRLTALTDPTSPKDAIEVNEEVLAQSLAILDEEGHVIGCRVQRDDAALRRGTPVREDDPFLAAVLGVWEPVYAELGAQDAEALTALSERYPAFREAYEQRQGQPPPPDSPLRRARQGGRLRARGGERGEVRALGYEYLVTEATNQWTGAAFEALGGVRVHFSPFRAQPAVPKSAEPLEGVTTSPDGYLSDKDSGGMFYVIRLA